MISVAGQLVSLFNLPLRHFQSVHFFPYNTNLWAVWLLAITACYYILNSDKKWEAELAEPEQLNCTGPLMLLKMFRHSCWDKSQVRIITDKNKIAYWELLKALPVIAFTLGTSRQHPWIWSGRWQALPCLQVNLSRPFISWRHPSTCKREAQRQLWWWRVSRLGNKTPFYS